MNINGVHNHFRSDAHQVSAKKFGMWIFLITEVILFGALFAAYAIMRSLHFDAFRTGSKFLNLKLGALNTLILLMSSLTAALAVYYAERGSKKLVVANLLSTIFCGIIFLIIKSFEYYEKIKNSSHVNNLFAGFDFPSTANPQIFFKMYFLLTGFHFIHVMIGIFVFSLVLFKLKFKKLNEQCHGLIEICALYWHLIDIIWIFMFPLLYLI